MAYFTGPNIVTDGLVFAVDAGSTRSYPGSGTTWKNLGSSGSDVALTNGPAFNAANGGYFEFDGTDDYAYSNSTSFDITGNVTINSWIRHDGTGNVVGNYISNSANSGYRMRRNGANGSNLWLYASGNAVSGGAIYDDIWYMVTGVFSSTGLRAYINGVLVGSNTTAYSSSFGGDFFIGAYAVGLEIFGGDIASAQVYSSALTASEVLQNFNAQKTRFGL
jgi:hypothetical protein